VFLVDAGGSRAPVGPPGASPPHGSGLLFVPYMELCALYGTKYKSGLRVEKNKSAARYSREIPRADVA
jgi:hypothetical protein